MKKIAAGLLALAIVFGAAADGTFLDSSAVAASAAAYTEDELKAKVQEGVDYELTDWSYKDYDGDGAKEGFALFQYKVPEEGVEYMPHYNIIIKYINSKGEVTELFNEEDQVFAPYEIKDFRYAGTDFALFQFSGGGALYDTLFSVVDGKAYQDVIDISQMDGLNAYYLSENGDGTLSAVKSGMNDYSVHVDYDKENHKFYVIDENEMAYRQILEDSSEYTLQDWAYDDFDGDGKKEAFGVFFGGAEALRETRFVDSDQNVYLMKIGGSAMIVHDVGNGKKVVNVSYIHQGYLHFAVYGVRDGEAYELKISSDNNYYGKIDERDGKFYYINYDERGTETENYEIVYDEKSGEFVKAGSEPTPTPDPVTTDYTYEENEDGTITITAYTGDAEELVIPSEIDGKTVSAIDSGIFSPLNGGNKTIKKITVPGSVKTIGEEAFACATALEEVYIEDGVTEIGDLAFSGCTNLKKITIPKSVEKIGKGAFLYVYHSEPDTMIDVTIYCYKDSAAHKFARGENDFNHEFAYVLLDEVSNPDPSSDSTVSADPSSAESGSSSGSTTTSTSSAAASSSGDKTSNPATGVAAGVSIAAVLAGGIIMVTKKTKK